MGFELSMQIGSRGLVGRSTRCPLEAKICLPCVQSSCELPASSEMSGPNPLSTLSGVMFIPSFPSLPLEFSRVCEFPIHTY